MEATYSDFLVNVIKLAQKTKSQIFIKYSVLYKRRFVCSYDLANVISFFLPQSDYIKRETLGCSTFFSSINVLFDLDYVRQ